MLLQHRQLAGEGPAVFADGLAPWPLDLSVSVTLGLLGVGLMTVVCNGETIMSGAQTSATVNLGGSMEGCVLTMSPGLYVLGTYTLVIP